MKRIALAIMLSFLSLTAQAAYKGKENTVQLMFSSGEVCSGTAIGKHTILTASHCFHDNASLATVNGLVAVDKRQVVDGNDHTLLTTDMAYKTTAKLARAAEEGDSIHYWGNPDGVTLLRVGTVVGFNADVMVIDSNGWYGDSGAGIMNEKGEVVGVISSVYVRQIVTADGVYMGAFKMSGARGLKFTQEQLKDIK